jgi:transposase-like protein
MMSLQKCEACRFQFNRSTGKSVKNAIIAYNLVALLLALIVFFVLAKGAF